MDFLDAAACGLGNGRLPGTRRAVKGRVMNCQPLPDDWTDSAAWLVQAIDPAARLARLVRMDAERYRAASFLDDRMLGDVTDARLCVLDELISASARIDARPANWIFHIGHVGSTLVSRLLGELGGTLSIREPRSLRDLCAADDAERPALALSLRNAMARPLEPGQAVVIKATSFVSDHAPLLIAPGACAMFLYATPRRYIEGILAGNNSVKELRLLAAERVRRLATRGIVLADFDASDAQLAAAAWLCEMSALEAAATAISGEQLMWADFDALLVDMGGALARIAAHFGVTASRAEIDAVVSGPLMHHYSKALEFDYSPGLRAELLAEAGRTHRADIDAALAALGSLGADVPLAARALARSTGEN